MGCNDDFCLDDWNDLCQYVGAVCINIETVIGGLIQNQNGLVSSTAPAIAEASGFEGCIRVHFDPTTCLITDTPNANTIPIGTHTVSGHIIFDGPIACVTAGLTAESQFATCGTWLDDNFDPIEDAGGGAYILIEDADANGCSKAVRLTGPGALDWYDNWFEGSENPIVIPPLTSVLSTQVITVPYKGHYHFSLGSRFNNGPNEVRVRSRLDINSGFDNSAPFVSEHTNELTHNRTFWYCLEAGDQLRINWENLDATNATTITHPTLQVWYHAARPGECP